VSAVTRAQVLAHRQSGSWRRLERIALTIINDVRAAAGSGFAPVLGGGTRLMLALNHRISHDLDLPTLPDTIKWARETLERYRHAAGQVW